MLWLIACFEPLANRHCLIHTGVIREQIEVTTTQLVVLLLDENLVTNALVNVTKVETVVFRASVFLRHHCNLKEIVHSNLQPVSSTSICAHLRSSHP